MDLDDEQLHAVCRTCLTEDTDMKNIFKIADIIMNCVPIQLEQDDGLPSTICSDCILLAEKFYEFRLLCQHSDIVLREKLHKGNIVAVKIEKNDLDSVEEVQADADCSTYDETETLYFQYQTNEPLSKIKNLNEIHENKTYEILKKETVEVCKNEILEDEEITGYSSCNTTQTVLFQYNANDLEVAANISKKKRYTSYRNKKSKVTANASNNEKVRSKSKSKFTCQFCAKKFLYKTSFQMHEQKHINGAFDKKVANKSEFTCRYCDKKFLYKTSFELHEQKHAEGIKCQFCDRIFYNMRQYWSHISIHKRKGVHTCPTCGKQYTFPENLAVHQRIHTGVKPFTCKLCNKSFTQWNELKSHEVNHSSDKPFLCSVCGMNFSRLVALRNHTKRIHPDPSNERPYACTLCDKKFKVRYDLTKHMLSHSDERNYECQECNKAFKTTKDLRQHAKIHTGQKPHVCPICQRGFLQKHVLITHLRTH